MPIDLQYLTVSRTEPVLVQLFILTWSVKAQTVIQES